MLFVILTVLFISGAIDAAPKPKPNPKTSPNRNQQFLDLSLFNSAALYPSYSSQYVFPFADYQDSFQPTAFLSGANLAGLDASSKQLNDKHASSRELDAKTLATFDASFGDKKSDQPIVNAKAKLYSFDNAAANLNVLNPFLAAKGADGKLLQTDNGLPGIKAGKVGDLTVKPFSLTNPFHSSAGLDPVFGPEIAPRYEIQYSPSGYPFHSISPYSAHGLNDYHFGFQPHFNTPFGPFSSSYPPSFPAPFPGFAPGHFPSEFPSSYPPQYPFPNPFLPGFDPKTLKPTGKDDPKNPSTESSPDTTTENFLGTSSESSTEPPPSSSEPPLLESTSESS